MDVISYSDTRANLKEVMDRVVEDRAPVVVTRQKAESVVMVSLSDWHAMEETLHLLWSPARATTSGWKWRNAATITDPLDPRTKLEQGSGMDVVIDLRPSRPETTGLVTRGAGRFLVSLGYAPLAEVTLPNGRRADLMAL